MFKILATIAVLIIVGGILSACADAKAPEWAFWVPIVAGLAGICTIWDRRKFYDPGR